MSGTTTYFGITYPTNTDYVKDGASAMQTIATGFDSAVAIPTYNNQTGTTYTFVLADTAKVTTSNNASAVTFTIPPQSSVAWATGASLQVKNLGAGAITFAGGAGVTVTNTITTISQYSEATLVRTGLDTWTVISPVGTPSAVTTLSSGDFSGVNAVNLSSVLSSTYKYYNLKIIVSGSNANFLLRARENTTDVTTSYAQRSTSVNSSGTTSNFNSGTLTYAQLSELFGSSYAALNIQIFRPDATSMHLSWAGGETYNSNNYLSGQVVRNGLTNFNGVSFYLNSGNMAGSYILTGTK
jgi:hypothetical protein